MVKNKSIDRKSYHSKVENKTIGDKRTIYSTKFYSASISGQVLVMAVRMYNDNTITNHSLSQSVSQMLKTLFITQCKNLDKSRDRNKAIL